MEHKYGKVAVIMRTKNRNLFLKRAINSVIKQIFSEWILVIVNDGGNKEELEKLLNEFNRYREKILVIHNAKSLGMEAASNKGISSVDSEYVVIHDDDDTWNEEFLLKTVGFLDKNQKCSGVITHTNKVIEKVSRNIIKIKKITPFNGKLYGMISIMDICEKNLFPPISFIYRRSVYDKIGGMYNENLPVLGDWEFNLRFIKTFDIYIIEKPLANYHQRPKIKQGVYSNSIIGRKNNHMYYENFIKNKMIRDSLKCDDRYGMFLALINQNAKQNYLYKVVNKMKNIKCGK